ncbi:MAG: outer membrane beta-barrel protein [Chitinophagaceae bacterium]
MKRSLFFATLLVGFSAFGQDNPRGVLTGNIMDERSKVLPEATIEMVALADTLDKKTTLTNKDGEFSFQSISFGYYQVRISYVSLQPMVIDSIWFRQERSSFNLSDLILKPKQSGSLGEVIVFAEKPLIQSKDGNITFNASESPLSAGSNASDLLQTVPLVSKDADGKISVRGKEPKILIDDKPVELNLQQLQDLLESLPGSSIEKIEVMTNPPPQYANEQGGVINIITKKGKVGRSGRLNIFAGSRGEGGVSGNFTYRKQGFALNVYAGASYNRFEGEGYSIRNNIYPDSSNFFNTSNTNHNRNFRPNIRVNMDYDISKYQSLNAVIQYNYNDFSSQSQTTYTNINRFNDIYRLSERDISSEGNSSNTNLSLSYKIISRIPGEVLRITGSANLSGNDNDRFFYQQFFNPDHTPNGLDSTQQQLTDDQTNGYNLRVNYDRPLKANKTFLSIGSYYIGNHSDITVDASYLKKPDNVLTPSALLSNDFKFHQTILNARMSLRQVIVENFSVTAGMSAEHTNIRFELFKENREAKNDYITWLPFANLNKNWNDKLNLSLAYRRSIRRPGINELNPTIDFSDPYNIRFGNEKLEASTSDNFDLVLGSNTRGFYLNVGAGYNIVSDIYTRVRTLLPDGKTQITWENISGRKEYEVSTWGGLTISKKIKTNISASYTYNEYSSFDKAVNRYRNGSSFTSTVNSTYTPTEMWNFTGNFTLNRFANPQGYAKWNSSMNIGIQRKLFYKKLTLTLNAIDPFVNQERRLFTYGTNFAHESFNLTHTRNFRFSVAYNFTKIQKRK